MTIRYLQSSPTPSEAELSLPDIMKSDREVLDQAHSLPGTDYGARIYSHAALVALALQREAYEREIARLQRPSFWQRLVRIGYDQAGTVSVAAALVIFGLSALLSDTPRPMARQRPGIATAVTPKGAARPMLPQSMPLPTPMVEVPKLAVLPTISSEMPSNREPDRPPVDSKRSAGREADRASFLLRPQVARVSDAPVAQPKKLAMRDLPSSDFGANVRSSEASSGIIEADQRAIPIEPERATPERLDRARTDAIDAIRAMRGR